MTDWGSHWWLLSHPKPGSNRKRERDPWMCGPSSSRPRINPRPRLLGSWYLHPFLCAWHHPLPQKGEYLWHTGRDLPIPHLLVEPEAELLITESTVHQELASHVSTELAEVMMRTWQKTLKSLQSRAWRFVP